MKYGKRTIISGLLLCWAGAAAGQERASHAEYIERYKPLAVECQEVYGIPASIKMAQALLESDCGNSRLAREANNHFGIKCKREWTGPTIRHDDDARNECFRRYASPEESFKDHSDFLDGSPRYQELFKLDPTDYKAWAKGLKQAGYATNPQYAELLIKMIEDHQLYLLDRGQDIPARPAATETLAAQADPAKDPVEEPGKVDVDNYVVARQLDGHALYSNNGTQFIAANAGDTFESLGRSLHVSAKRLRAFNELPADAQPAAGDMIYVKQKMKRAENGKLIHLVKEGDTMRSIAQQYGIRLRNLARMNLRGADARLLEGQQIRLR